MQLWQYANAENHSETQLTPIKSRSALLSLNSATKIGPELKINPSTLAPCSFSVIELNSSWPLGIRSVLIAAESTVLAVEYEQHNRSNKTNKWNERCQQ